MLYLAWYHDNYVAEIQAYQGISLNYFYLGQLKKAKHYIDRVLRGKSENAQSIVRQTAVQLLTTSKNEVTGNGDEGGKRQLKIGFNRIPSPSGFCQSEEGNKQINLLPYLTEYQAIQNEKQKRIVQLQSQPTFTSDELTYLNNPPKTDYLKQPIERKIHVAGIKKKNVKSTFSLTQSDRSRGPTQPFTEEQFRKMV